jgi:tetratricopeptide (TPR) repeat protein
LTGGRPDIAIDHCNQATLLAGAADSEIKAFAESCLAQVYTIAGRLRDAVEVGEPALARFEAHGNLWWAGRTLWHLSVAANCLGEWDASLNYCRCALDHGIALNDLRLKVVGWLRLGSAYIQRGNLDLGLECCSNALGLAPTPYDAAMVRAAHGYAQIKAGNYDAGIAELSEVLAWSERSHLQYTRSHQALWLAEGHIRRGDPTSAKPLVEEVLSTSQTMGYLHFEGRARWLLGECLATEAPPRAEHEVKQAISIFKDVGAQNDLGKAIMTSAGLRRNVGDFLSSRQLYIQAREIFCKLGTFDELRRAEAVLSNELWEAYTD